MKKVLVVYPSFLAGLGPATWLAGTLEIAREFAAGMRHPIEYVGPELLVDENRLVPDRILIQTSTNEENYLQLKELMRKSLANVTEALILSVGYTSYTSWAVREVIQKNQNITLMVLDSSPPDTDLRSSAIDIDGVPASRFHWPAYADMPNLKQYFYLFSTYAFSPNKVRDRIPEAMSGVFVGRHPYTVMMEEKIRSIQRQETAPETIPIICAGDYWNPKAIGKWMTKEQYDSMRAGTSALIHGLNHAVEHEHMRITVPIDMLGWEFAKKENIRVSSRITFLPFQKLSHTEHWKMMRSAIVNIARGGNQTNATVAATLMETPFLFWNVPGHRYMQTWETNLQALKSGNMKGFDWNTPPGDIAEKILAAIKHEGNWKERPRLLREAYEQTPTLKSILQKVFTN